MHNYRIACCEANARANVLKAENDKLKAELEQYRWIPVGKRLPEAMDDETEYSDYMLCYNNKYGHLKTDQYLTKRNKWSTGRKWTHWKPIILPADPATKEEE